MKIDIRNIFGSGSSGASVDVKQVMESGAEQPEADASSEAAQMTTEGGSSASEPTPASNERAESGQADAAGGFSSGQQLESETPPELEQDEGTLTDEDLEADLATNKQAESGKPKNVQAAHKESSSLNAQENIETAESIETIDKAEVPEEIKEDSAALSQMEQKTNEDSSNDISVKKAENESETEQADAADMDSVLESISASDERAELEQAAVADGSIEPEDQLDSNAESKDDSVSRSGSGDQPDSIVHQADEAEKQAAADARADADARKNDGKDQQTGDLDDRQVDEEDQKMADDAQQAGGENQDTSVPAEKQAADDAQADADARQNDGKDQQTADNAQQAADEDHEVANEAPETVGEAAAIPKQPLPIKEKFLALCCRYGWCTGIAAAFAILLAVTLIYTTLTPREVYATINDKEFKFTTKEYTVEEFLQDEKIAFCEEDYISMPLTTYIYDGMEIQIDHATDFKVTADGKTKKYKTLDNTVQEALDDAGIKLRDRDIVTPSLDAFMTQDIHIVVQRVEVKQEVVEEAIPFQTVTRNDSSLKEGTTKVATQGQEGKDQVTYEVTYIDGVEASRTEIARQSVTAAVDEVIAKGTRIDYNGKTYSRKLVVKAYAYTGGGRTAMGTRARVGEIAVDRSVIPLGTNVYIEGVGARRAEDTGGNIKGNTIDIYMDSEAECRRWGVRYVTIYIQ